MTSHVCQFSGHVSSMRAARVDKQIVFSQESFQFQVFKFQPTHTLSQRHQSPAISPKGGEDRKNFPDQERTIEWQISRPDAKKHPLRHSYASGHECKHLDLASGLLLRLLMLLMTLFLMTV